MPKRRVAVLGATGTVGQQLVRLLLDHPLFELAAVGGSARRAGTPYGDTLRPLGGGDLRADRLPSWLAEMSVQACVPGDGFECDLVFSALPAEVASGVEPAFARAGYAVASNARTYRMEPDVPLVIPEVNHEHLALVETQREKRGWRVYCGEPELLDYYPHAGAGAAGAGVRAAGCAGDHDAGAIRGGIERACGA